MDTRSSTEKTKIRNYIKNLNPTMKNNTFDVADLMRVL